MIPVDRIPYRRWFPWLRLFQSIELALSVRQIVVATLALFVLWAGHACLELLAPEPAIHVEFVGLEILWDARLPRETQALWSQRVTTKVMRPWDDVVRPGAALLQSNLSARERLRWAGDLAWSMAVWSLFGLALCRLSGRRFAREEEDSVRKAIQYGQTRWWRGIVAPLIPALAAIFVMAFAFVMALPGRLPLIGSVLAFLISPLLVIFGLAAAWLLIAILLGWPLMLAAIAMDDCDGFGGLSRSYSMWTGRPWYYTWCVILAAIAGTIAVFLAGELAHWVIVLASTAANWGTSEGSVGVGGGTIMYLVVTVLQAYCVSFFWTSATIIYALLRQSVDSIPLDIIAPDEPPPRDPFPVAGIPAIHQPAE